MYFCHHQNKGGSKHLHGAIAQLVEQRTENPCVPGSIPGGTTTRRINQLKTNVLKAFVFLANHWPTNPN